MNWNSKLAAAGVLAVFALSAISPMAAQASQKTKNDWRNATAGSAGIAALGLLTHNSTLTVLGAGGAAYSANRYEQDRHHQSQANGRRYHRSGFKSYWYNGHEYRQDLRTGDRSFVR